MKKIITWLLVLTILLVPFKTMAVTYEEVGKPGTVDDNVDGIQFNPEDERLDYNSLCNNQGVRQTVKIIGYVISICKWIIPMILIILGMLDYSKAVVSNDEKALSKATSSLIKRFIAGVIAILVPTIIMAILNYIKVTKGIESSEFGACTTCLFSPSNCGTGVGIKHPTNGGATTTGSSSVSGGKPGSESSGGSSGGSSNKVQTTYFKSFDVTNLSCSIHYADYTTPRKFITFDAAKGDELVSILNSVCNYVKTNPYIDKIQDAGFAVNRPDSGGDYHAKGLAFDLNTLYTYTDPQTKKSYRPYGGQGTYWWENYKTFICEVCGGREDCDKNVNYQIYNKYFKPKGWCWGGSWSPSVFDPMHIEYSNNCGNRSQITC